MTKDMHITSKCGVAFRLLEAALSHLVFDINIGGERKEVRFDKRDILGHVTYNSDHIVYVTITEATDYYFNKVRPSFLQMRMVDGQYKLSCDYEVLNRVAHIISWIDSERGRTLSSFKAKDGNHGSPTFEQSYHAFKLDGEP